MIDSFDITYARVIMYVPKHKPRKMKNATPSVAFFFPDGIPSYVYGCDTFLSYSVNEIYYKIYNPQKFVFDFDELKNHLYQWHLRHDKAEAIDFRIVKTEVE